MATMQYLRYPVVGSGSGSVTSVGLALPGSVFSVSGSPVTTSGTLTATFTPQSANTVFAGPTSGGPGTPAFRALVAADIPVLAYVTNVTASAPLVSSGGTTPNISTTVGNLTDAGTDGITVTGGTGAVFGSGTSLSQHVADTTHNGYLSSADWNTFNGKEPAFTAGNLTAGGPDGITIGGPVLGVGSTVNSGGATVAQQKSDATHSGYLSLTDWNTFNNKQAGPLTGDVTTVGAVASLVATTNATITTLSSLSLPAGQISGTLGHAHGGTDVTSPGTSGNLLTSNGTNWVSSPPSLVAPTVQTFTSGSGTYTRPTSPTPLYIKVTSIGAGGGGGGSGSIGVTAGSNGGDTTFGTSLITAGGGTGGTTPPGGSGGTAAGGSATGGTTNIVGQIGEGKPGGVASAINAGYGGCTPLGFGGPPGISLEQGYNGNGFGAGGGGASNNPNSTGGGGGGAGGYVRSIITSPSSTYTYAVGASGTGGSAGTLGYVGGNGAPGYILVEEFYQ